MSVTEEALPETAPSWPEYLKEVSRRSKAGFGSVHNELLQRFGSVPTKDVNERSAPVKQQVKQNRMSSRFFRNKGSLKEGKDSKSTKPKERKNSLRQTFISYVEEDNDMKTDEESPTNEKQENINDLNIVTDLDEQIMRNIDDLKGNLLQTEPLGPNNPEMNSASESSEKTENKSPLSPKRFLSPGRSLTTETIYQMPRQNTNGVNNRSFDNIERDSKTQKHQPFYSNLGEFSENDHYECPKELSLHSDASNKNTNHMLSGGKEKSGFDMPNPDNASKQTAASYILDAEDDYVDMQGTINDILQRERYKSCSAIEDKLGARYENTASASETLFMKQTKSAPPSPFMSSSKLEAKNTHMGDCTNVLNDTDEINEYVGPDPVEREEATLPRSATVTPYIQESESPRTSLVSSTRPFVEYTVEEVIDCFEICALSQVAKVCKEESLDGEYFQDLSDEDLKAEPFCLSHFHISKLRKIIAGWRPKRLIQ